MKKDCFKSLPDDAQPLERIELLSSVTNITVIIFFFPGSIDPGVKTMKTELIKAVGMARGPGPDRRAK